MLCGEYRCNWRGTDAEVLHAPNPFDPEDEISGCPKCKEINSIYRACDEPGCWDRVSCGTTTPNGYRQTCGKHRPRESVFIPRYARVPYAG